MARVNERGMFEKPRWIAVGIRFGESEGRRRDCKERQGDEKGFTARNALSHRSLLIPFPTAFCAKAHVVVVDSCPSNSERGEAAWTKLSRFG
jgi:hypothetical protein